MMAAMTKILPTSAHPLRSSARRALGSLKSVHKYAGRPAFASRMPARIASTAAVTGWISRRACIGPLRRAAIPSIARDINPAATMGSRGMAVTVAGRTSRGLRPRRTRTVKGRPRQTTDGSAFGSTLRQKRNRCSVRGRPGVAAVQRFSGNASDSPCIATQNRAAAAWHLTCCNVSAPVRHASALRSHRSS
jgi:hypothetical protein